jgi:hypothetical protein
MIIGNLGFRNPPESAKGITFIVPCNRVDRSQVAFNCERSISGCDRFIMPVQHDKNSCPVGLD